MQSGYVGPYDVTIKGLRNSITIVADHLGMTAGGTRSGIVLCNMMTPGH